MINRRLHKIQDTPEARVNQSPQLKANPVTLDSFIVSPTPMAALSWEWNTLEQFAERHVLMMQDEPDGYIRRMLKAVLGS